MTAVAGAGKFLPSSPASCSSLKGPLEFGLDMSPANNKQPAFIRLSRMLKVRITSPRALPSIFDPHQLVFAQSLLYQICVNLVKAAFTFQYLRIFSHLSYPKYHCYILFLLIIGATAWGVFGIIFLCNPVKTYWDVRADGKCMNAEHHFWSTSIVGIIIDWAIWILPMPIVGRLRLPRRQKIGLWIVFGFGGL